MLVVFQSFLFLRGLTGLGQVPLSEEWHSTHFLSIR
jgi:hypothetical protein